MNKKNHENFYEFKLIRQISDFDLINNIYVNKNINFKDDEEDESKEKNDNKENEDMIIEKTEEEDKNEINNENKVNEKNDIEEEQKNKYLEKLKKDNIMLLNQNSEFKRFIIME